MARILIVDDNPDVAFMVREKLAHLVGGDIETAHGGEECLQMARDLSPDLILLDINMPVIDGFEVCRILKQDPGTREIPVIFMSATYDDLRSKIKGLDIGADDYMVQPVDDLELVTRVRALLKVKELKDHVDALRSSLHQARRERDWICERARSAGKAIMEICRPGDDGKKDGEGRPGDLALISNHAQALLEFGRECLEKAGARSGSPGA